MGYGNGNTFLPPIYREGGDADVKRGQVTPHLPTLIDADEMMEITVLFHPYVLEVLQIGNGLWERQHVSIPHLP